MIYVKVPASTANLGPGFDALGLALRLYLHVRVAKTISDFKVVTKGHGAMSLPQGKENLIHQVVQQVAREKGRDLPNLLICVNNEIPLARGLGSSAAAIVAGILIADKLCALNLSEQEMLCYALRMEGHPDNITPSLVGGFVASCTSGDRVLYVKSRIPRKIKAVVVVPDFELSTAKARAVLPETFPRNDVIYNLQRVSVLVAALKEGKETVVSEAMRDLLHQPYRKNLVPGLEESLALQHTPGLLGIALSGAGPTILALATDHFKEIGEKIKANFREHSIASEALVVGIDNSGARVKTRAK